MTGSCCDVPLIDDAGSRPSARRLAVRGFVTLWRGERRPITDLTEDRDLVRSLTAAGRLQLDDDDTLVGVHGLTTRTTAHRIVHAAGTVHTWCTLDAIGIPAALALDATAVTTCPGCGRELRVTLRAGEPDADAHLRLWVPAGPCSHLVEDFCRHTNLYCRPAHLTSVVRPDRPGRAVDLTETAAIGRTTWRDIATCRRELTAERT